MWFGRAMLLSPCCPRPIVSVRSYRVGDGGSVWCTPCDVGSTNHNKSLTHLNARREKIRFRRRRPRRESTHVLLVSTPCTQNSSSSTPRDALFRADQPGDFDHGLGSCYVLPQVVCSPTITSLCLARHPFVRPSLSRERSVELGAWTPAKVKADHHTPGNKGCCLRTSKKQLLPGAKPCMCFRRPA